MDDNEIQDINAKPLPRLDSTAKPEAHYLLAILRELQWARKNWQEAAKKADPQQ